MYTYQIPKETAPIPLLKPQSQTIAPTQIYGSLSSVVQRAQLEPSSLSREEWLHLESAIGSRGIEELKAGKKTPWVPEFRSISAEFMESSEMLKEARQGQNQVNSDYDAIATVQRVDERGGAKPKEYHGYTSSQSLQTPLKKHKLNIVGESDLIPATRREQEKKYIEESIGYGSKYYWQEDEFITESGAHAVSFIDSFMLTAKKLKKSSREMSRYKARSHKGEPTYRNYLPYLTIAELVNDISLILVQLKQKIEALESEPKNYDQELTLDQKNKYSTLKSSSLAEVVKTWSVVYQRFKQYFQRKETNNQRNPQSEISQDDLSAIDEIRNIYIRNDRMLGELNSILPPEESHRLTKLEPKLPETRGYLKGSGIERFTTATNKLWQDLFTQELIDKESLQLLYPRQNLSQLDLVELYEWQATKIYMAAYNNHNKKRGVWKIPDNYIEHIKLLARKIQLTNNSDFLDFNLVSEEEFDQHFRQWLKSNQKSKGKTSTSK